MKNKQNYLSTNYLFSYSVLIFFMHKHACLKGIPTSNTIWQEIIEQLKLRYWKLKVFNLSFINYQGD